MPRLVPRHERNRDTCCDAGSGSSSQDQRHEIGWKAALSVGVQASPGTVDAGELVWQVDHHDAFSSRAIAMTAQGVPGA